MQYNYKGKYNSTTAYVKKDVVSYQPTVNDPIKYYFCLTDNTGQTPVVGSDTVYWAIVNTLSNFPNNVDTFLNHTNIQASDKPNVSRYQELSLKSTLTTSEQDELSLLTQSLREKLILPQDFNALQESISNMQMYLKDSVEGFINQKQSEMQSQIDKFTDRGEYSSTVTYQKNNFVTYNFETYICTVDNTINILPTETSNWRKTAARGSKGEKGDAGLNLVFKNSYDPLVSYVVGDAVEFQGSVFYCKQNVTGETPSSNGTSWTIFMARASIAVQATAPTSPTDKQVWVDSSVGRFKWFDSSTSTWKEVNKDDIDAINSKIGILTEFKTEQATENQRLASEDNNLRQLNANLQKEVAYLKLQQEASARIENGTTFADDLNGNSFGMTYNDAESTNIVIRDGTMMMLESTQTTNTVTDATVVASAYDTSGNGGRKLVRLSNGWLVAGVWDSANSLAKFYKTEKGDWTDETLLCSIGATKLLSLDSVGNMIYGVGNEGDTTVRYFYFDATTQNGGTVTRYTLETQTAVGGTSLAINEAGTELHAAWASKNSTYANSFNIRYAKGTINADGSVTWGSVVQVTKINSSGVNYSNPTISLFGNVPIIICDGLPLLSAGASGSGVGIVALKSDLTLEHKSGYLDSNWSAKTIFALAAHAQSSPSSSFIPKEYNGLANGRLWVSWQGLDSTDTTYHNLRVSYSDDGGVNWATTQKLTNGNSSSYLSPTITANKNGKVVILAGNYHTGAIGKVVYENGTWGPVSTIKNTGVNTYSYPSALFDLSVDFTEPLFIYKDTAKVGFYGTWTVDSESPTLTGTAVYDLPSTDYVGAFVQKAGAVNVDAYINDVLMDESLEADEYMFTKGITAAPVKLRLELSRADTTGGNNDRIVQILGGVS